MEETSKKGIGGIWGFIKAHAAWIGGGTVAIIVAWYLFLRPQSSSAAPTSVSFPPSSGGGSGSTSTTTPTDGTPCLGSNGSLGIYSGGVCTVPSTGTPPPPATGSTPTSLISSGSIPGVLSTIAGTFGYQESTQPATYAQNWVNQFSSLLNIPAGVAASAWNTINANPGQYVSQLGAVNASTAAQNIANLVNSLLNQYNLTPGAFNNITLAPLNTTPPAAPVVKTWGSTGAAPAAPGNANPAATTLAIIAPNTTFIPGH